MWRKVEDTKHLDSTLNRMVAELEANDVRKTAKAEITAEEKDRLVQKRKKNARTVAWVFLLSCILALISIIIVNYQAQEELKTLNSLTDTRLLAYENQILEIKKVSYLFSICDNDSYAFARNNVNWSDSLRKALFATENYQSAPSETPKVTIEDIRYTIKDTDDTDVYYLLYISRATSTETRHYILEVRYTDNQIADLLILN